MRRSDAGDAGEGRVRDGDARQLRGPGASALDLPLDEVRIREDVCEVAEAGDDRGHAEPGRFVCDKVDLEEVAGFGSLHVDGPGERVPEAQLDRAGVLVRAVGPQLAGDAVFRLEPQLIARRNRGDGLEVGVPAVVHPHTARSARTRSAASWARARSSSVQVRGAPSWCSETMAASRSSRKTGVTIWAASPP